MSHFPPSLADRCRAIDVLIVDVDGVLTRGGIGYADDGRELKTFHVRDGTGLKIWQYLGKHAAILTGRSSAIVTQRAAEVGVATVVQGATEKMPAYRALLKASGWAAEQVCYVGDDLPDLPPLRNCGLAVAVADACPDLSGDVHFITQAPGGGGAVRETIELILRCQGRWQPLLDRMRAERLDVP
jgi:3-deoxy-D-manno-octulosonate 8-phosphate phosphatase (KDO 8-P phosphatase)